MVMPDESQTKLELGDMMLDWYLHIAETKKFLNHKIVCIWWSRLKMTTPIPKVKS
jgi:hypothetical protein